MNGHAHGAVTILNATATGRGCSMAIDAVTEATWHWGGEALAIEGAPDARLADACWRVAQERLGRDDGASIRIRSDLPHARGLKTSSSAATAMLRAAGLPEADVEVAAVQAARQAGVTLTGAFDDQVALHADNLMSTCQRTGAHWFPSELFWRQIVTKLFIS